MKTLITLCITTLFFINCAAQDTFSIVAVDSVTGEIGSAGASCIDDNAITGGAIIISDIIPGRGAIHTQAYWRPQNQQNAHDRMTEGLSPQEIIDWLVENDAQNNPTIRQYGIVDFDTNGSPRAAAYTGSNCTSWAGDTAGVYFAIQGNILLGEEIIDSMLSRFLNTEGIFAEKLMSSLQGANVPGADTRCAGEGVSSLSAFIRVAQPGDTLGDFFLDLNVPETPYGVEPIDSLQVLFDEWLLYLDAGEKGQASGKFRIYPNPASHALTVETTLAGKDLFLAIYNSNGNKVRETGLLEFKTRINTSNLAKGIYFIKINNSQETIYQEKVILN